VHLNEQATRVEEIAGGQLVVTGSRSLEADAVVLCLGARAATVSGAIVPPMHAVGGRIRVILPLLPLTGPIITAPGVVPAIVPLPDGRVAIASTYEEPARDGDGETELALLVGRAQALVPALTGAAVLGTRRGERPFAPDHLPVIGATEPAGVFVAGGHGRMGVVSAPLTARVLADLVTGSHSAIDVAPFSPLRTTAPAAR
jgi:glycine oxidase